MKYVSPKVYVILNMKNNYRLQKEKILMQKLTSQLLSIPNKSLLSYTDVSIWYLLSQIPTISHTA